MSFLDLAKAYTHISYETIKDRMHSKSVENLSEEDKQILSDLELNGVTVIPNYYSEENQYLLYKQLEYIKNKCLWNR